jgi:hypothetical protein
MLDKKKQALALIEKTEDLHPEKFCELAFPITEEVSVIDNKFTLGDRYHLARTLLVLIIKRQGDYRLSVKDYVKPEEKSDLMVVDQKIKDKESGGAYRKKSSGDKTTRTSSGKDYYAILGVSPTASKKEIRSAYRKLMVQYHPDKLLNMDLTDEQINEMEKKVREINEAEGVLYNDSKRKEYDSTWNKESDTEKAADAEKPQEPKGQEQEKKDETDSEKYTATVVPTASPSEQSKTAQVKVKPFQEDIKNAGSIDMNVDLAQLMIEQKSRGELPMAFKGIPSTIIIFAGQLHSKGIEAVDVFKKTYDSKIFNEDQKVQLYTAGYVMSAMEDVQEEVFTYLKTANLEPEVEFERASPQMQSSSSNQILISSQDNLLTPVIEEVKGRAASMAKQKVKKFASKALKKGAKKITKSLLKKAAKKGVTIAVKAGIRAAALSAEVAAGVLTGGVGFLVVIALEALNWIKNKISKYVTKFLQKITGDPEITKKIRYAALGVLGFALVSNFMIPAAIAGMIFVGTFIHVGSIIASIAISALISLFSFALVVTYIVFIINSGAYVVPEGGFDTRIPGSISSPYIKVEKMAQTSSPPKGPDFRLQFSNGDIPLTVTYTVTITATKGTLSNVTIMYNCTVSKDTGSPSCPPDPTIPLPPGNEISPVQPFTFTYTQTYSSTYRDSLISDTITVSANAEDFSVQTAAGAASICIGDCPEECPSIWPLASGYVTQGPDTGNTHARVEAIDFGTFGRPYEVFATHNGIIRIERTSCEGNVVNIESVCEGKIFNSRYSHLGSISVTAGQQVDTGQVIGRVDNTGTCTTGTHLHYAFQGLTMDVPYIPRPLEPSSSCCTNCGPVYQTCTTILP